ncbi:MAG: gliding motility protein GldN [Bacteroidota bacterium]|nr:gliding motility protein GldN [Bacteroidota bacterium]
MKRIATILTFLSLLTGLALTTQAQTGTPVIDGIYNKSTIIEKKPVPYTWVRESDVVWSRRIWRVIDVREKMNQPFYFPEMPHNNWRNLTTVLFDALKEGKITAYDAMSPTDEFVVPLSYADIMKRLEGFDSLHLQRSKPPYDWYDTVVAKTFNPSDIKRFRIKEDWFFDKQRSVMEVRIIGICPVRDNLDKNGNFRAFEPLFWIYYPEARPILAKAEVFNFRNGAERRSYDDIFMKRLFSSYIYKEENVFDRKITDYAQGIDAMLESDRIKRELIDFEEQMWEY